MCLNTYICHTTLKRPIKAYRFFSVRYIPRFSLASFFHFPPYPFRRVNRDKIGSGFYVYNSMRQVKRSYSGMGRHCPVAEVRISGAAQKFSNGWKAERLRIVRIYVYKTQTNLAKQLRKRYKVPVILGLPRG